MKTRVVHVDDNVPGAVYIGRANRRRRLKASPWANRYRIGKDGDRAEVIRRYAMDLRYTMEIATPEELQAFELRLRSLVGKPLACHCRHDGDPITPYTTCHGDIIVELIQRLGLEETEDQ